MPSLQDLLKQRLTTALKCGPPGAWKSLVVDDYSKALLESVYKLFDVLQLNITAVDLLMSPRPPQPGLEAVYLLTPTTQNVNRIIADFAEGRRTYKGIHLYFIDGIDDRLADRLTASLPPDALLSFVELYCNFWPVESQVFSFKSPSTFFTLFGNPGGQATTEFAVERFDQDVKFIGRAMLNLLATLGENPLIRYYNPSHHQPLGAIMVSQKLNGGPPTPNSAPAEGGASLRWKSALTGRGKEENFAGEQICRRLARQIQSELDDYKTLNPEFPPESQRPKAMLFVLDRSIDPVAPFLHEFTYQAMVNDLLPIEDGTKYKYIIKSALGTKEEKIATLSEEDKIWTRVRHMHMKEAIDTLMADFNKFTQEHAGFRGGPGENASSLDDMKDMLASLPQFQETRDKFSLHLDMAQECMALFEERMLPQSAHVEQCCATGVTPEGKTPRSLVEEMVPLLDAREINNKDKVRIIALYILFRDGVPDEDRKRLYQHARLSLGEQDSINNLVLLGQKVVKAQGDRVTRGRIKPKLTNNEEDFELSRYKPIVKQILEDQVNNKLDLNLFPYVRDAPVPGGSNVPPHMRSSSSNSSAPTSSLRSARPTWHKAPATRIASANEARQRIILFVAGGLTYSEQRQAYLVGEALNKEVIIGSTHNINPDGFINDLRSLNRAGIGGNPPNAAVPSPYAKPPSRGTGSGMISYQSIIDSRIWSEPVGPPPLAPPPQQYPQGLQPPRPEFSSKGSFSSFGSSKKEKNGDKEEGGKRKGLFGLKRG